MPRRGLDTEAVVTAAATLADDEGLERLTLARLAAGLGIRTPSLYAHVDGLGDLRARLAVRGARELTVVLSSAAAGRSGLDALRSVALAYRDYAHAHPGTYAATQVPADREENQAAARDVVAVVAAVLAGYGLEGDDMIHAVRAVRSALHGFVSLEREGGFALSVSRQESYDRLIAVLNAGLSATLAQ
jgi:AcrR family transcriptional regulator